MGVGYLKQMPRGALILKTRNSSNGGDLEQGTNGVPEPESGRGRGTPQGLFAGSDYGNLSALKLPFRCTPGCQKP
ncbi:hypothetical protein GCM10011348_25030 [Marinobacterium nitratireducens]|uniref:Uncharacterized protein n=1 Tax=Marinobacterium nitratireducens TaxID=518897 RepID=A0A917ZGX3_9GAMM|nr:hypothetical protein GCM10011348_25030 [Marinobacterium nitratireducens]